MLFKWYDEDWLTEDFGNNGARIWKWICLDAENLIISCVVIFQRL